MESNERKDIPHGYTPQYQYQTDFQQYFQGDFSHMASQPMGGLGMAQSALLGYEVQPHPQLNYPSPQPQEPPPQPKIKGKRRSKNDTEGRDFKCQQCERTYLSYPALYTHIKTKHPSSGEMLSSNGRGRGRPKKIVRKIAGGSK